MWAEHIKGWLTEARKEEAAILKIAATEGKTSVIGGTGGEDMEERGEKTPVKMTNWERVVELVMVYLGEGVIAEENMWQAGVLILKGK